MYQSALDLFCVSLIILFCLWLSSCGMLPNATNPTLEFSKGDKIDGGGAGTQGVGEAKVDLNFSDNNSKKYERSTLKNKDTSNQLKASQDKTIFSIGGEHTDLSRKTLRTYTRSNTADDYVTGNQNNNVFNVGINRFDFLPFDPQKNSIEPFRRIGENTVLEVLDKHENDCKFDFTKNTDVGAEYADKTDFGNPKND